MNTTSRIAIAVMVLVSSLSGTGCSEDKSLKHFQDTYVGILMVREQVADTALANSKVDSVLKANGYTKASFKATYMDLSRNSEAFRKMMDSVHSRVQKTGP